MFKIAFGIILAVILLAFGCPLLLVGSSVVFSESFITVLIIAGIACIIFLLFACVSGWNEGKKEAERIRKGLFDPVILEEEREKKAEMRARAPNTFIVSMTTKEHEQKIQRRAAKAKYKQSKGKPLNKKQESVLETLRKRAESGASWNDPDA